MSVPEGRVSPAAGDTAGRFVGVPEWRVFDVRGRPIAGAGRFMGMPEGGW